MAYFSLHAYDADVRIPEFRGLMQGGDEIDADVRYAVEEKNLETLDGVLQPQAPVSFLSGEFEHPVETLMWFYRRWYSGYGGHSWFVAAVDGQLYYRPEKNIDYWDQIVLPSGTASFSKNAWSYTTYETNASGTSEDPVDVLIISNNVDGMYMITPPDRLNNWTDIKQQTWEYWKARSWIRTLTPTWNISPVDTNGKKIGVITRYAERIWGCDIADNPDMLMYSAPYDPTDWEANVEIPENGAGDIMQPSWDGDKFTSLKAFGNQLLAFKRTTVWRVYGTDPGSFTLTQQYGGGAPFYNTVAVDGERVLMAERDGLAVYDGMTVSPYQRETIRHVWSTVNRDAMDQMCAAFFEDRYYLAFPTGDSAENNALLILNTKDGSILYCDHLSIESFYVTETGLYATSSTIPGKIMEINRDSWSLGQSSGAATKWVSPWMALGNKKIQKGGFEFYFTPEVQNAAVDFTVRIQTEKKIKTKQYTAYPLKNLWREAKEETWEVLYGRTWYDVYDNNWMKTKFHRDKRLHFSGAGRRFRLIIETAEGNVAPWRLIGGIQMVVETDSD